MKTPSTIAIIIFCISMTCAQNISLDENFGDNGRIELSNKEIYYAIYYNEDQQDLFTIGFTQTKDQHSNGFKYFNNTIYKFDTKTGKFDKNFGRGGKKKISINTHGRNIIPRWHYRENHFIYHIPKNGFHIYDNQGKLVSSFDEPEECKGKCQFKQYGNDNKLYLQLKESILTIDCKNTSKSAPEINTRTDLSKYAPDGYKNLNIKKIFRIEDRPMVIIGYYTPEIDSSKVFNKLYELRDDGDLTFVRELAIESDEIISLQWNMNKFTIWDWNSTYFNSIITVKNGKNIGTKSIAYKQEIAEKFKLKQVYDLRGNNLYTLYQEVFPEDDIEIISNRDVREHILGVHNETFVSYNLKEVLPSGTYIQNLKQISDHEVIILAGKKKNGKYTNYLYKLNMN